MTTSARLVPLHPVSGNTIYLTKEESTLGRSRSSDVYLEDPSVSRLHAWIRVRDGAYVLEDNHSLRGTKVNGKSVESQRLADNDVIELGIYSLRFVTTAFVESQTILGNADF